MGKEKAEAEQDGRVEGVEAGAGARTDETRRGRSGLTCRRAADSWAAGTVYDQPEPEQLLELTVIVPARNEEECLGPVLQSLVAQSEEIFKLGRDWELIVVDDHSTDRTAEIARGFAGVTVMEADELEPGWTGKANAIWTAARKARGRWLLFTDADTIHEPGDLHRAMHEAARHKVGMLSYSPRQIVSGLAQRTLMPLVFCELALAYPPAKVSDPNERIAAANGQFLLVEREAYRKLGGHAAVADKVLEDVELAFLAKRRKVGLRFRYAEDAVATRMYRTTAAMMEGWTKNLALLFQQCAGDGAVAGARHCSAGRSAVAGDRALECAFCGAFTRMAGRRMGVAGALGAQSGPVLLRAWRNRIFRLWIARCLRWGCRLFVWLLYRSWFQHRILKQVSWKGRTLRGLRRRAWMG